MSELVCPTCKSGGRLYSTEQATIDYAIRVTTGEAPVDGAALGDITIDDRTISYEDEMYRVNDEGTQYDGSLYCRNCAEELTLDQLIPEPDGE